MSRTPPWTAADLPDQRGRTWLITGATHGLGRQVAQAASAAGARVVLPARDEARAQRLCAHLPGEARALPVDLADLASVRAAAAQVDEPIDVLVNNAGTVTRNREVSVDGFEMLLATNFLGPFAFTNLIMDRVRERIVIVGSGTHSRGIVDVVDPHFRKRRWSMASAYAQSKLADMLWAWELERRLRARGATPHVQLAHPGWALTNLQNKSGNPRVDALVTALTSPFAQSAAQGALPLLYAATMPLPPLSYIGPDGLAGMRGYPTLAGRNRRAADPAAVAWVWRLGVELTGTDFPTPDDR